MNSAHTYFATSAPAFCYEITSKEAENNITPATQHTPLIAYNKYVNALTIQGASKALDIQDFYCSAVTDFKEGFEGKGFGQLRLELDTFNASSAKVLFDLFKFLGKRKQQGEMVKVYWDLHVNDVDMVKTAMDFSELFDLDIIIGMIK